MHFKQQLSVGQTGESVIAKWFIRRGFVVLPVYDVPEDASKGPRVFTSGERLIAPDMLAFKVDNVIWVEAKTKSAWSMHRNTGDWVTGIDLHHYLHYQELQRQSGHHVILAFLQRGGIAKGDAYPSPAGLYIQALDNLRRNEHHRYNGTNNYGKSGMVFWAIGAFEKRAELYEVLGR
jgi:hypothetical protein